MINNKCIYTITLSNVAYKIYRIWLLLLFSVPPEIFPNSDKWLVFIFLSPIVFRFLSSALCYDSSVMPLLISTGDRVNVEPYIIWLTSNINTFQYFSSFENEWDLFLLGMIVFFLHFTKYWVFVIVLSTYNIIAITYACYRTRMPYH